MTHFMSSLIGNKPLTEIRRKESVFVELLDNSYSVLEIVLSPRDTAFDHLIDDRLHCLGQMASDFGIAINFSSGKIILPSFMELEKFKEILYRVFDEAPELICIRFWR